jgi:hypothetical protein
MGIKSGIQKSKKNVLAAKILLRITNCNIASGALLVPVSYLFGWVVTPCFVLYHVLCSLSWQAWFHEYILFIYTPNLRSRASIFVPEREQGRFNQPCEGGWPSSRGVSQSTPEASRSKPEQTGGAPRAKLSTYAIRGSILGLKENLFWL